MHRSGRPGRIVQARRILTALGILLLLGSGSGECARAPVSERTETCLGCHSSLHPGIVEDWQRSRHAAQSPQEAMAVSGLSRKISAATIPPELLKTSVGCAECHTLRPGEHADTFLHNEEDVHVVVTPGDCAVCHSEEARQYSQNIMAFAHRNLEENPVFQDLQLHILGRFNRDGTRITYTPPDPETKADACLNCHGTRLYVKGIETRDTILGEMMFPMIEGWPNQGVGRVNMDGSLGGCAACHTRHRFSIETARQPDACKKCHVGPDVPAYKVYNASKHGGLYQTGGGQWNYAPVPWTMGKDFSAPTCAVCHISLLVNTDGETVAVRTHRMNDRLSWRLFGLIYAHPHPLQPDTTIIRNTDGLPLPTDLDGDPALSYLIDGAEQEARTAVIQGVCIGCHSSSWVAGHWRRYERTIMETNQAVKSATDIMQEIWARGYAKGLKDQASPFDEAIERDWADLWLFYGNTIRFSAAMAGGGDYGVFANGRYQMSRWIRDLAAWLDLMMQVRPSHSPIASDAAGPEAGKGAQDGIPSLQGGLAERGRTRPRLLQ